MAAAAGSWQSASSVNPALAAAIDFLVLSADYWRPYGLAGVDHLDVRVAAGRSSWSVMAGTASLGFDRFREVDVYACGTYRPGRQLAVGLGLHWLLVDQGVRGIRAAPAVDLGMLWQVGRFRLGAAGRSLNRPDIGSAGLIPPRFLAGFEYSPVDELILAADATYCSGSTSAGFGCEFLLIPQLAIRAGVGTAPLRFGGGLGVRVGPVGLDYAYGFHPQLGESHHLGVTVAWH
ncbi:hypothetical protein JXB37_06840 [candidate division WOR-3 bacterium]|nr:hypothetical protein [candidate division WOR-3 bacterium]